MAKTILIADDNDDLRSMLAYQLQPKGYRILMAADGNQALAKIASDKPDLVLLDVMMPGMDGTEVGAQLKADPVTSHIPIIYLTSLVQGAEPSQTEALSGGLVVPKSVAVEELIAKIESILSPKDRL